MSFNFQIWKTLDKQKKLDWVKKLPAKEEKMKIVPKRQKTIRHEVPYNIGIDTIKSKSNVASLSVNRYDQNALLA